MTVRPPRRTLPYLFIAGALVATVATGAWFARDTLFGNGDPAAGLSVATVQRGLLEDVVTATGTLQPRDYVDVGAQVSGLLNHIHVEVGDMVESGQLLAEIDARVLASRVDATRAQLRNQRAQLLEREASLELAELQAQRQRNLMREDATTREALQTAEASLRAARAQIEALKAQIEQTEASLRADEANLEYTRISAPMAGTVVSITARQGQTLNANQSAPTILRIADLSTMTVETQVSEADVGRLRPGMSVWFTTLGGEGQRWEGTLRRIDPTPTVTNNVVLYNALFEVPNTDRRLMTQMTAQVFFVVARAEDALSVPIAAVSGLAARTPRAAGAGQRPDGAPRGEHPTRAAEGNTPATNGERRGPPARKATVRVLDDKGAIQEREVQVGLTSRIAAQIVSGLEAGERVVVGARAAGAAGTRNPPMPPR
ncbi:MAG: efflux RND transporter periplasmic adaptor subunit [Pseudazoarcus pumilus]|nr:efflux RND transporter periplasmic adaptor subunit [Pseudazoarcus pumilus]